MINCKTKTRKELIEALEEAYKMLYESTDNETCDYDHHDYCQTHYLGEKPCVNERALEFLELWGEHGK